MNVRIFFGLVGAVALTAVAAGCGGGEHSNGGVNSVAFSPDGRTVAAAGEDGTIRFWDVRSRHRLGDSLAVALDKGTADDVNALAFSRDGHTLAAAGDVHVINTNYDCCPESNGQVWIWDLRTRQVIHPPPLYTGFESATSAAFSPDGRTLVSATGNIPNPCLDRCGDVRVWDTRNENELRRLRVRGDGVRSVAFSPDGHTVAVDSSFIDPGSDPLRLWNIRARRVEQPLPIENVQSIAFSPGGRVLAAGTSDGTVEFWDVRHHRPLGQPLSGFATAILSIAFSPDGRTLAAGADNGRVLLWNVRTHKQLGGEIGNPIPDPDVDAVLYNSVAFSADGRTLASGDDYGLWLWDVRSHKQLARLSG